MGVLFKLGQDCTPEAAVLDSRECPINVMAVHSMRYFGFATNECLKGARQWLIETAPKMQSKEGVAKLFLQTLRSGEVRKQQALAKFCKTAAGAAECVEMKDDAQMKR